MKKNEILGILILMLAWEGFSLVANNFFFPDWILIIGSMNKVGISVFVNNIFFSIVKILASFGIGNVLGLVVGGVLGTNQKMREISNFGVDFMRSLPSTTIFPLFMILFGINETTKILVTTFGIFWIVVFNTVESIGTISVVKIKYLKVHGSDNWDIIKHYVIYVLFQNWLTIVKITLSLSLFITITLEMFIGSEYGIGKAIVDAKNYYEIPTMYFWIIVAGLVGYGLNRAVTVFENRLLNH